MQVYNTWIKDVAAQQSQILEITNREKKQDKCCNVPVVCVRA